MLHSLVQFAQAEGLSVEPGFKSKSIRWALVFQANGKFVGVVSLEVGEGKNAVPREFERCPDLSAGEMVSAGDGCRPFLVDTLDVIALLGCENAETSGKAVSPQAKNSYWVALLAKAKESLVEFALIAKTLRDEAKITSIREALVAAKAKPKDVATIAIERKVAEPPELPVKSTTWHGWWREFRAELAKARETPKAPAKLPEKAAPKKAAQKKSGDESPVAEGTTVERDRSQMLCLLSGEWITPRPTHPKVSGLASVGGHSAGDAMSSFDKDAFCSFNLEQGANAAISPQMAATYTAALNKLLKDRNHCVTLAGAKVVYWFSRAIPRELDPIVKLTGFIGEDEDDEPNEEKSTITSPRKKAQSENAVRTLLESPRTGEKRERFDDVEFHALTLSGNSGRVVVRDAMEGRFEDLKTAVDQWFEDLALCTRKGEGELKRRKFESYLTCGLAERKTGQDYENWIGPVKGFRQALWSAAITGRSARIPRTLVSKACDAVATSVVSGTFPSEPERDSGETTDPKSSFRWATLFARLMLMKAYLVREANIHSRKELHMEPYLDEDHPSVAYQTGRMMAVLQMIQRLAQGKIGASIAQTHYAAAATRPMIALPRLQTLTQHHLAKIDNDALRDEYQRLLSSISGRVRAGGLPRAFDLEDQCLFHLGYYQQLPYEPYADPPHRHYTLSGDKVRSKSEVVVANLLTSMGIAFEYEPTLRVRDGQKAIYPDFRIKDSKFGKPIYIEHLGMMDRFTYRVRNTEKIEDYRAAGILDSLEGGPNGILIVTDEDRGAIDSRKLKEILARLI